MPSRPDDDPTIGPDVTVTSGRASSGPIRGAGAPRDAFAPGAIVAGRYRLVALLGRGGMGEVYRADDLTLDQPVALKFLPAGVAADAPRLAQFHNELRIARQVSHKNVCRLYDLGEADGRRFITMEYVDGEDLASLLRRIGRIPQDKAIDIARQLCAGLAAAHERGVLHRDLKPANVMLDGDGNVRLTDFGLAIVEGDAAAERAGTPQYMAPEQLRGEAPSVRSDIYALGLVLFELFTGRRVFDAKTFPELLQLHETQTLTPSSVVRDLDPAVERAIMRCLERDPAKRPGTALVVAAALPGADPLAAALAAGETPSPELLIAAGETGAVPLARALAAAGVALASIVAFLVLGAGASIPAIVPLDKPPAVLIDRIQQMTSAFGYTDAPADSAFGFSIPPDYPAWAQSTSTRPDWWGELASGSPPALVFWYRTSPRALVPQRPVAHVTPIDPPSDVSGMRTVVTDTQGRLVEFHAAPPQFDAASSPAPPTDWKTLFDAAGLEMAAFHPVAPEWTPRGFADARQAWEGPLAGRPDVQVRVEAAAYRGRPSSFYIVGPWTRPSRMEPVHRSPLQLFSGILVLLVWNLSVFGAALLAWRHVRAHRADTKAATRLTVTLFAGFTLGWLLAAHHTSEPQVELGRLVVAIGLILINVAQAWVLYVAIEPVRAALLARRAARLEPPDVGPAARPARRARRARRRGGRRSHHAVRAGTGARAAARRRQGGVAAFRQSARRARGCAQRPPGRRTGAVQLARKRAAHRAAVRDPAAAHAAPVAGRRPRRAHRDDDDGQREVRDDRLVGVDVRPGRALDRHDRHLSFRPAGDGRRAVRGQRDDVGAVGGAVEMVGHRGHHGRPPPRRAHRVRLLRRARRPAPVRQRAAAGVGVDLQVGPNRAGLKAGPYRDRFYRDRFVRALGGAVHGSSGHGCFG